MTQELDILVTRTEATILDQNSTIVYHELAGEESIMPVVERHRAFFRRLSQLARAMTNDPFKAHITINQED